MSHNRDELRDLGIVCFPCAALVGGVVAGDDGPRQTEAAGNGSVTRSTAQNETRTVQCCGMVGARQGGSSALRIALRTSAQWQLHPGSATMRPPGTHAFPNRPRARTSAGTQPPGKGARRSQYQTARGRQHHGRPIGARDVGGVGRGDDRLGRVGRDGPSGSASCAAG